jgi:hypothetical protein
MNQRRPLNVSEVDFASDAEGNRITMSIPDDPSEPIALAGQEEGAPVTAEPVYLVLLNADQAIELGRALVRAGVRKQVIEQLHGIAWEGLEQWDTEHVELHRFRRRGFRGLVGGLLLPAVQPIDEEWSWPLYDEVIESLSDIEEDTETPPTRAELPKIAHIKALIMIGQCIEETVP